MSDTRTCKKCGDTKPVNLFYKRRNDRGYSFLSGKCRACIQSAKRERYASDPVYREHTKARSVDGYQRRREAAVAQKAQYRSANKEEVRKSRRKSYYVDLEASRKCQRDRYASDPNSAKKRREFRSRNVERERLVAKLYRVKMGEKLRAKRRVQSARWREENRDEYNSRNREYYATSINRKIGLNLRNRINSTVRYKAGQKQRDSLSLLLGCTIEELKAQFESQFTEGMTWEKFMSGEIHIDHIKPCASFDLTKVSEQKKCFHHTNLQPLWAEDNLRKSAKLDFEVPSLAA